MDVLHGRQLNVWRKSLTATTQECCLEAAPNKATAVRPPATHHENYQRDEPDMQDNAGEVGISS